MCAFRFCWFFMYLVGKSASGADGHCFAGNCPPIVVSLDIGEEQMMWTIYMIFFPGPIPEPPVLLLVTRVIPPIAPTTTGTSG